MNEASSIGGLSENPQEHSRIEELNRSAEFIPRVLGVGVDTRNEFRAPVRGIRYLYISPGHNFFDHHGKAAGRNPILEVAEIECVAGRGIRGDRFFDYRENYKGQITFFAFEVYALLCEVLSVFDKSPSAFRRNVITEGMDFNALVGEEFVIQGVHFRGTEECKPCYWMDEAFAPGTEKFLRGRGGLRAVILSDGKLSAEAGSATIPLA